MMRGPGEPKWGDSGDVATSEDLTAQRLTTKTLQLRFPRLFGMTAERCAFLPWTNYSKLFLCAVLEEGVRQELGILNSLRGERQSQRARPLLASPRFDASGLDC